MAKEIKDKIPGDPISIRTKRGTPQYILDGINRAKRANGNDGLIEILELGVQAKKLQENQGIFIPLPAGLTSDEIEKASRNDALLTLIGNIIKSSTALGNDIQFGLASSPPSNQLQSAPHIVEQPEKDNGAIGEPPNQKERPKAKKKRANLRGKGLTKMKRAFD